MLHGHLLRMVDASATALRAVGSGGPDGHGEGQVLGLHHDHPESHTLPSPIDASPAIGSVAGALWESVELDQGVRLLGVSLSGFGEADTGLQLSLDLDLDPPSGGPREGDDRPGLPGGTEEDAGAVERLARAEEDAERIQGSWATVTSAVDAIRARYGGASVGPASLVESDGLRVRGRGEAQWGPSAPVEDPDGED